MPPLDETLALTLIERGGALTLLDRGVLLATAFADGATGATAADLPLDQRDSLLIDARIAAFGPALAFFCRCPHCGEGNEAEFDLAALPPPVADSEVRAEIDGEFVTLRAPTSRAVARATMAGDPAMLATLCADGLTEKQESEIETALACAFPLIDIRFEMACNACEAEFDIRFDIVAWLWNEVEAVAQRAVDAVDRLARAYGWAEREVLALSPARRAMYLARVG